MRIYGLCGFMLAWVIFSVVQIVGYKRGIQDKFSFLVVTAFPVVAAYFAVMLIISPFVFVWRFLQTLLLNVFNPVSPERIEICQARTDIYACRQVSTRFWVIYRKNQFWCYKLSFVRVRK